ncbi:hypothetical protein GA0070612_5658 [Micromonospora chokoriensis]|uniref:Uncharacterized protein n=1 Tax=Micromonospora chokoriensis TaxID=356851 RepID=A0A1C4Z269_9ACTN|nr:hypothetical protein GA0070612_5658 [Micromonospora chokoriensis]
MASGWRNGPAERESNTDVRRCRRDRVGLRRAPHGPYADARVAGSAGPSGQRRGLGAIRGSTYGGPAKIRSDFNSLYARLGW